MEQRRATNKLENGAARRYLMFSMLLVLLHVFFMAYRYGHLPIVPMVPEEVIINDASISLARGQGYVATSFADSKYGLDHLFAHFPPLYPYTQALAFRVLGVSAYSLRITTTVMSVCSTLVLMLLLLRLCRAKLLDWNVAVLINALYCTNPSFISFERAARMESMVSFLTLLSLSAILCAATRLREKKVWPLMLLGGFLGALCMAVHPEAVTALLFLGCLLLFLIPSRPVIKLISVSLFALVPLVVGLAIYGRHLVAAVHQFLDIAHDSNLTDPTSREWLIKAIHDRDLSTINRNLFLLLILILLALAPASYLWLRRRLPRTDLRYRLASCLCVVGILEILLMVFVFRMVDRRFQFLFGPLLVCNAMLLVGSHRLPRWGRNLGWALVLAQCCVVCFYFSARSDRVADLDPDRFLPIIHGLPANATVASTPGLWLDFEESQRPFTLILYGLDGESEWIKRTKNPLDRFDVVIIEDYYAEGKPWWAQEARVGRTKYSYTVGSDKVDIYMREPGSMAH